MRELKQSLDLGDLLATEEPRKPSDTKYAPEYVILRAEATVPLISATLYGVTNQPLVQVRIVDVGVSPPPSLTIAALRHPSRHEIWAYPRAHSARVWVLGSARNRAGSTHRPLPSLRASPATVM